MPAGRVWKFGNDINTDLMLPGPLLTASEAEQARAVFSANRPGWIDQIAPGDPARRSAEYPILGIRQIDLDPELRANRGHQLAQQPAAARCRLTRCGGHSCTSRPVNQPAASNARRASSTVRCP